MPVSSNVSHHQMHGSKLSQSFLVAQIRGVSSSRTLRLRLDASSTITLRARALRREVSQSVAAHERVEERAGQGHGVLAPKTSSLSGAHHKTWRPLGTAKSARVKSIVSFRASQAKHNAVPFPRRASGRSPSPMGVRCTSNRKSPKLAGRAPERPVRFHQALANQSLNRTFCCGRPLAIISFLTKAQPPQNAG